MGDLDGVFRSSLLSQARTVMTGLWNEPLGYCAPNLVTYPWQWLWDSCFHAVVWAALGDQDRAVRELSSVFAQQTSTGFVPHMSYAADLDHHRSFWGIGGASTITQPPMYGHALAVLAAQGIDVEPLLAPVTAAFRHLFERRATPCGLLFVVHPWENGTDDSPRWERWQTKPFDHQAWWATKGQLVQSLVREGHEGREAVTNPAFAVCPAGWNALVAFNASEAAAVTGDRWLADAAARLSSALDRSWVDELETWVDVAPDGSTTSSIRTADALLGALVTTDAVRAARVLDLLVDPAHYGTPFGPAGVHVDEPTFDPVTYWRGVAWPPLDYLWRTAADRRGWSARGERFDQLLVGGAREAGWAEYRDPCTGTGLGAIPQAWSTLAAVPRSVASPASGPPASGPPASGPPALGRPASGPPASGRLASGPPASGPPASGREPPAGYT